MLCAAWAPTGPVHGFVPQACTCARYLEACGLGGGIRHCSHSGPVGLIPSPRPPQPGRWAAGPLIREEQAVYTAGQKEA